MVEKTDERYFLERRLRQMKKDLAYDKKRPSTSFLPPFDKKSSIKQMSDKIKKLERKLARGFGLR
tara:strand:- start:383 stop:577 length:195 start_codon:yes stop_codon:yes gene_type:complete